MTMHIVLLKDSILKANNFTSLRLIPNVGFNYQGTLVLFLFWKQGIGSKNKEMVFLFPVLIEPW